jgi:hypothetical protein
MIMTVAEPTTSTEENASKVMVAGSILVLTDK